MRIQTVVASTGYPIDLEDVKNHLRLPVGETNQDDYLMGLITVAMSRVEEMTNRALTRRTLKTYYDEWPYYEFFELPYPPLSTSADAVVKYVDVDSSSITLSSTAYKLDAVSEPGRLVLDYNEDWPSNQLHNINPISVQFVCGYPGSTAVPQQLKQAMKLIIADLYENRESVVVGQAVSKIPDAVQSLVRSLRIFKA
jgi:uncharacterized phiE125 gp8 family phage protein